MKNFGQDHVSDPGNNDPNFERIKTRALLAALEEQHLLSRQALLKTAERARQARAVLTAEECRSFDRAGGVFHHWGGVELSASCLAEATAGLLLRQVIYAVSGASQPPGEDQTALAVDDLRAKGVATLSGTVLRQRSDAVWIYREPAALLGRAGVAPSKPLEVMAGEAQLWDGRFAIRNISGRPLKIGPYGADSGDKLSTPDAPAEAFHSVPAIHSDGSALRQGRDYILKSLIKERFFRRVNRFQ